MHYTLSGEERALRASFRGFLALTTPLGDYEAACERESGLDERGWKALATSGWLDLHAMSSSEVDGSVWPIAGAHMAEELGRTLVAAPVELVAGFLVPVLRQLSPGAFGVDLDGEPFAEGVPTVHLRPLLASVYPRVDQPIDLPIVGVTDDGVTLSGVLPRVEFAASAGSVFVPVLAGTRWALVRVDLHGDGVTMEAHRTVDPGRTCATVRLDAVRLPADDVVCADASGAPLDDVLADALLSYLLVLDGKAVGACELLLERSIRYVTERKQFGVPIGSFQAVKHRIADMATAKESARSLASYAAWLVAQRHEDRTEAVLSSRLFAADAYRRVCESAIQCHGGMGFTWDVGLHFWYRSSLYDAAVTDLTLDDLAHQLRSA